ncbi:MAG: LL-diaminopimelate aminotransferase [Simkaniaceae bacterium]|nr:LL-diaminopimelate aminotransferase [Candidatus Sacchlamyda saccharinae]
MLNPHFQRLKSAYIFPIIEKKLAELQKEHPNQKILNLGIGDVCLPLAPKVAEAICEATREMTESPRGYGPCGGYDFLKDAICEHEYASFGITPSEIFISDGANSDSSCLQELFADDCKVIVTDPTYPVYRDANLIAGKKLITIPLTEEEGFIPRPPKERADLVYLCSPCNPTGVAMNRSDLEEWIAWAQENQAILLIDNVYNGFATSEDVPKSIYALEGANEVAIEIRSFSKWAGFTGLRCGYSVVPKTLHLPELHSLWQKRIDIKTNGVSYPIQKGALACYYPEVKKELDEQLAQYKKSASILRSCLKDLGQTFFGGIDAPYIFWKAPTDSWTFFDELLTRSKIISIPGSGFGPCGEGFVRLSCFITPTTAQEAADALYHHFATV